MARCARCRVELVGTARFCASCGAAVSEASGAPSVASSATNMDPPSISIEVPSPASQVNPFASTASPSSLVNPLGATKSPALARAPSEPPRVAPTPVSPLASSGALSERGAFHKLVANAPVDPATKRDVLGGASAAAKKPRTQMMTHAPARAPSNAPPPASPSNAGSASPAKKRVARTVAMGHWGAGAPKPANELPHRVAAPSTAAPSAAASTPNVPPSAVVTSRDWNAPRGLVPGGLVPGGLVPGGLVPGGLVPGGLVPGGLVPGARVTVTWSNGQRYPATLSQVNGPQCLVVFANGQQHWVEHQFVAAT